MRLPRLAPPIVRTLVLACTLAATVPALASAASLHVPSTVATTQMRDALSATNDVPSWAADDTGWYAPVAAAGGVGNGAYNRLAGTDWLSKFDFGVSYNPRWNQYKVQFTQLVSTGGVGVRLLVDNVVTAISVNGGPEFGCTLAVPCAGFYGTPFAIEVPSADLNAPGTPNTMIITVFNGDPTVPDPDPPTTGALDFDIVSGGAALRGAAQDTAARATQVMTTSGSFKQAFEKDALVPITLAADNAAGSFVDNGDGTWSWTYTAPKGTAPNTSSITVTASSASGSGATDVFDASVLQTPDTSPPVVTAPSTPADAEATDATGAVVSFGPATVTDDVDADTTATCAPASGSAFPVGDTLVACSYTDAAGTKGADSFHVTVLDTTGPVLSVPDAMTVDAGSADGALVSYPVSAADAVDGSRPAVCTPPPGSRFAPGTTNVTCTATDRSGNARSATFTVSVKPWVAPPPAAPAAPAVNVTCASLRTVVIHVGQRSRGRAVRAVHATIDGQRARVGRQKGGWTIRVDMRGRAHTTVPVRLTVRLANGRAVISNRAFRTCRTHPS